MKRTYISYIVLLLLTTLQSCFIFGIKGNVHYRHNSDYKKLYSRNHIKNEQEFYVDTSFYNTAKQAYKNNSTAWHDHLQPTQYLLFDKRGRLQSFMVNCFVHTNFLFYGNWNYEHAFDTFPTKTQRVPDSSLTLWQYKGLIRDIAGRPIIFDPSYDYTEIIIFGSLFYRVSKELIRTVKHQDKHGYKVKTYYVNCDDLFVWRQKEQQKIKPKKKLITITVKR